MNSQGNSQRPYDRWAELAVDNFSGGLNLASVSPSISFNEFVEMDNLLVTNEASLKVRPSIGLWSHEFTSGADSIPYTYYTSTDGAVLGVYNPVSMVEDDENLWLLASGPVSSHVIKYGRYATASSYDTLPRHVLSGYTGRMELCKYSIGDITEMLIATDLDIKRFNETDISSLGLDYPVYSESYQALIIPRKKTGKRDASQGITKSGDYYYKFTYYYESKTTTKQGEGNMQSRPYKAVVELTSEDVAEVFFSRIPYTPEDPDITKINIYRSPPNHPEGPYKLVGFFDMEDSSITSYIDDKDYLQEGIDGPLGDNLPPRLKHPVVAGGRLWGFDADRPNKLVWSNVGQPDVFLPLSFAYLTEEGTGLKEFRGNIYVFSVDNIYAINIDEPTTATKVSSSGCVSHETIVNTGTGLMWLGKDNIYWANFAQYYENGDFPIPQGDQIKSSFILLSNSRKSTARGFYWNQYYFLSLNTIGSVTNEQTLIFNTSTKSWSVVNVGITCFGTYNGALVLGLKKVIGTTSIKYLARWGTNKLQDTTITLSGTAIVPLDTGINISIETRPVLLGQAIENVMIASLGASLYADMESISITAIGDTVSRTVTISGDDLDSQWTTNTLRWNNGSSIPGSITAPTLTSSSHYYSGPTKGINTWADRTSSLVNVQKRLSNTIKSKAFKVRMEATNAGKSEIYRMHVLYRMEEPQV